MWKLVAAFATVAVFWGCGGGGGAVGGGGGGNLGDLGADAPAAGQYLEFRGVSRSGNLDPMNLQVGDTVQVQVVNYDGVGNRTVLAGSGFSTTAGAAQVTISSTGRLVVKSRPSGVFRVTGRASVLGTQKTFQRDAYVPALSGTTISGQVRPSGVAEGIKYIQVDFFDSRGVRVGGAVTGDNGNFKGLASTSAVAVSIRAETVNPTVYFRTIKFSGRYYTMDGSVCPVPIGGLRGGQDNALGSPLFIPLQAGGPPPPPDGC